MYVLRHAGPAGPHIYDIYIGTPQAPLPAVISQTKVMQSKSSGALVFSSKSVADNGSADLESSKSISVIYDSSKEILPVKYSGDTATAEIDGGARAGADGYNHNSQLVLPEHAKNKLGKIGPMKASSFLRATSRFV